VTSPGTLTLEGEPGAATYMGDFTEMLYVPAAKSRTASPFRPEIPLAGPTKTAVKGIGDPV
jgi:hypothetical protein